MAISDALRVEFLVSPKNFMNKYFVTIMGGLDNGTARANPQNQPTLLTLMPGGVGGDWDIPMGGNYTNLVAPLLYAYFDNALLRDQDEMIPFARSTVLVKFDSVNQIAVNQANVAGVPVSLIPYLSGRSYGVKLPAGGDATAFAMTSTMDGCTLQISGSNEAPFVSHTNVGDIPDVDWLQRQGAMTQRLFASLASFVQNIADAPGNLVVPGPNNINNPNYNSFNYGFWTNHYPQSPGFSANYKTNVLTALTAQLALQGGKKWRGARSTDILQTTSQYWLDLLQAKFDENYQPMYPCSATAIGIRENGRWQFYSQEVERLSFLITRESTTIENAVTNTLLMDDDEPEVFEGTTIMNTGLLWTEPTRNLFRLDGQNPEQLDDED